MLLHGGGNFGDLWPRHHAFRLAILERFPDVPKIHFPQSIHFRSEDVLERTRRAVARQRDFVLLVRDRRSHAFASRHFDCRVELCPDMAFCMAPLIVPEPRRDVQCLLRTDHEILLDKSRQIARDLDALGLDHRIDDWIAPPLSPLRVATDVIDRLWRHAPASRSVTRSAAWRVRSGYMNDRVRFGARLLSRGRVVVTDRLHGHVLSVIIGRPNIVFDSLDGKVSALYETWTSDHPKTRFIASVEEMRAALDDLGAA
jgi:pyruvyl transferase EpsO